MLLFNILFSSSSRGSIASIIASMSIACMETELSSADASFLPKAANAKMAMETSFQLRNMMGVNGGVGGVALFYAP